MTVAALILSILAIIISGASAWYARVQAVAAEDALAIERGRRHDEREPEFMAEIRQLHTVGMHPLALRLVSGPELAEVTVTIAEGGGVEFTRGQNGVHPRSSTDPALTARWENSDGDALPLRTGEEALLAVELGAARPERIRLDVTCQDGSGERWDVTVWAAVPPAYRLPQGQVPPA